MRPEVSTADSFPASWGYPWAHLGVPWPHPKGVAEAFQFLVQYGYVLLFAVVLGEQLGLPLLGAPVLLAAGALAALGRFSAATAILLAVVACLIGDSVWYQLGRRRGISVLAWLCRISLEPDSCVRRTEDGFARYGPRVLLVAKFVPGLNTVAPPLSGVVGMERRRFLAWDTAGALVWSGSYIGLGYLFSSQLERVAIWLSRLGTGAGVVVGGALGAYVAWKYLQRRRLIRSFRMARITPSELDRKLEAGEDVVVVDLRSVLHAEGDGMKVPGALRIGPEELERRHGEIPRDREIVLYCS